MGGYPDMFNEATSGAHGTGLVEVDAAMRTVAGLAIRHEASLDELRDVLEALGLIGPQGSQIAPVVAEVPAPTGTRKPESDVRAFTAAGRTGTANPRRTKDLTLCGKQLHKMWGSNVRHTSDGGRRCKACARVTQQAKRAHETARDERHAQEKDEATGQFAASVPTDSGLCPRRLHRWDAVRAIRRGDGRGPSCRDCHNATRRSGAAKRRARIVTEQIGDES